MNEMATSAQELSRISSGCHYTSTRNGFSPVSKGPVMTHFSITIEAGLGSVAQSVSRRRNGSQALPLLPQALCKNSPYNCLTISSASSARNMLGERNKLIAGAKCSENVARFPGNYLQFLPQLGDMQINGACIQKLLIAPHLFQKNLPRKSFPRVADEIPQQPEFFRRELDDHPVAEDLFFANI